MFEYLKDKYFEKLGNYNKCLLPHKQTFWADCPVSPFRSFLSKLSFNLDPSTNNFKYGKRYFSNQLKSFTWASSNDGFITKFYYDRNERVQKEYKIRIQFNDEMMKDHFLSSIYKKKRKIGFYYKSTDKEDLDNYEDSLVNMYMVHDKTYGATQQLGTNVLLLDIDNRHGRKALVELKKFMELFNIRINDLIFIEQNAFTGGIHTALVLPHKINDENFYQYLMETMFANDINLECNFINNILRFPLSYEYVAIKHSEKIFDCDEFISEDLWEPTFKDFLLNLNSDVCPSEHLNRFIIEYFEKKNPNKEFDKYHNYWKIKRNIIVKDKSNKRFKLNFKKITSGNRYNTMSKIVPYAKAFGKSLSEVVEIIRECNESSKDLYHWSNGQLLRNISKFYNNCTVYIPIEYNSDEYVPNYNNIPEVTKTFLDNPKVKAYFIKHTIDNINKLRSNEEKFNRLSDEKIDILIKLLPEYYKELFGLMFYSINTEKHFVNGINEELGFQLPDIVLKRLQSHLINKFKIDSPIAKTSIQFLKKALLMTLGVKEIKYRNRERNWQLGSCKSYRVKSINDINMILDHVYNSINSKDVITYFINNLSYNNDPHILYILPEENQGVDKNGLKMIDKIDDPPPFF